MVIRSLKGFGAFSAANAVGQRVIYGPLGLTYVTNDEHSETPTIFVGVSISKRHAPLAVKRNRMRRLLREAARRVLTKHHTSVLEARMTTILLVWRSAPPTTPPLKTIDVEHIVEGGLLRALSVLSKGRS